MRDKSLLAAFTAAIMALLLVGCSSVTEAPYPNLGEITPAEDPSLSPEERATMIEELKQERQTHKASTSAAIEKQ